jgi:hypothetical protein
MAIRTTPIFVQAGTHPAEETRLMLGGMLGMPPTTFAGGVAASNPAHGIVSANDFVVTQNGTPNMTVLVGVGGAFIRGTENLNQGAYHVWNDASQSVSIATAHPTLSRRDLIVVSVTDQAYSGGTSVASISVVTGTPGTGTDPTPPANALVLARVTVAALDTAINTADITDLRPIVNQRGKIPTFNTSALATAAIPSPVDGQAYYLNLNTTDEGPYFFNGTNYRRPWNMPWGAVSSQVSSAGAGFVTTTETVIYTAPSTTFVANRRYRWSFQTTHVGQAAGDLFNVTLRANNASGTLYDQQRFAVVGPIFQGHTIISTILSPGAVTFTPVVTFQRVVGSLGCGTAMSNFHLIEDIGPSGAPT